MAPAPAQTLGTILGEYALPARGLAAGDLDHPITGYAVENAGDLFVIAFVFADTSGVSFPDTLRLSSFDRVAGVWTHAAIERRRLGEPGRDIGSVVAIHHTARHVFLDTHGNPSAGTLLVFTRDLAPVAALDGWLLRLLPGGLAVYHQSMIHFAPTHSAELRLYDADSGRDVTLYPREPDGPVRRRYVAATRQQYARVGADWFRNNNHPMDPRRFTSALRDSLVTNAAGTALAFLMRFGNEAATPVATPLLDVVVHCRQVRSTQPQCSETELATLQRRHPRWDTSRILHSLLGRDPAALRGPP